MKSSYNKDLHIAIPTLDYIRSVTGIDIILEEGNEDRAKGKVISLSSKARDFLMVGRSPQSQRVISYLIFKEIWLEAWLNYVVKYIEATFYYGDESSWESTPKPILNAINGSVLVDTRFTAKTLYEVEYSTEDF